MKAPALGAMRWSIEVMRRVTLAPMPFRADSDHAYTRLFHTRAACDTSKGVVEFNRVATNVVATHIFLFRFTMLPFDVRDYVRDSIGNLYTILSVEDVEQARQWHKVVCARVGSKDRASVT